MFKINTRIIKAVFQTRTSITQIFEIKTKKTFLKKIRKQATY